MKPFKSLLFLAPVLALLAGMFSGCETTDDGGGYYGGTMYYGVGYYDDWYYDGHYHDDPDIIVSPPDSGSRPDRPDRPDRPPGNIGAHPEHPIARPPANISRPMPSIPSTPRVAPRMGGGRR